MKPVVTERTNTTYVSPGCGDLPATRYENPDGSKFVEACFELDEDDKEVLAKTGRIYVHFVGHTIIPMNVAVHSLGDCPCSGDEPVSETGVVLHEHGAQNQA